MSIKSLWDLIIYELGRYDDDSCFLDDDFLILLPKCL